MKVFYLMMAMALGALPVNAQLDQQWKNQEAGNTVCRNNLRLAKYVEGGIFT